MSGNITYTIEEYHQIIENDKLILTHKSCKDIKITFEPSCYFDKNVIGNTVILSPKYDIYTDENILNVDLTYAHVKYCRINNNKYNYEIAMCELLHKICEYICDNHGKNKIRESKVRCIDGRPQKDKNKEGYYYKYNESINMSIAPYSNNDTMKHIYTFIDTYNIPFEIEFKLSNGKCIKDCK